MTRAEVTKMVEREMRATREAAINGGALTAESVLWDDFYDQMQGPRGCDFRERVPGDSNTITWKCDNTPNRPIARRVLAAMGYSRAQVELSLAYFQAYGGHCDCEILFNVKARSESA